MGSLVSVNIFREDFNRAGEVILSLRERTHITRRVRHKDREPQWGSLSRPANAADPICMAVNLYDWLPKWPTQHLR
jgi:hypothetical protein